LKCPQAAWRKWGISAPLFEVLTLPLHLRQAAPLQPLVKPLKIKNIIPLKARKKEATMSRQRREQEKQKEVF